MWQFCETVSSGSVLIRDRAGKEHSFVGNFTTVEIDVVKDDVVIVEGRIAFFIRKKGCLDTTDLCSYLIFWNVKISYHVENIICSWKVTAASNSSQNPMATVKN